MIYNNVERQVIAVATNREPLSENRLAEHHLVLIGNTC